MPFIGPPEARVYYRHWKAPAPAATVVLLHGYGEHGGHYHRFATALNLRGIDVIGMDLVGHGLSYGERAQFGPLETLVSHAAQVVRLAQDTPRPIVVVGHSLGAVVASLLAARTDGLSALVLTGGPFDGLVDASASSGSPVMSADDFYLDALANDPLGFDAEQGEATLWARIGAARPDVLAAFRALSVPVLLVNGECDVFAPPSVATRWAAEAAHSRLVVVPGGHHDILNDVQHHEVERLIGDFVLSETSAMPVT